MTVFVRKIGGTEIPSPISKNDCINFRDSLAKAMYDKMFNWIVMKLNNTIQPAKTSKCLTIGLLDIFGFELFKNNSFEQFCINFTNEKLQQLYINYVFKAEVT
jgi:myosin-7